MRPGMEEPEQAEDRYGRQNRRTTGDCDAERNQSSEEQEGAVEKSRYCLYLTRTVNRHRWMRRES